MRRLVLPALLAVAAASLSSVADAQSKKVGTAKAAEAPPAALTNEQARDALDAAGLAIIQQLASQRGASANLAVSPASIASVMGLLDLGASREMKAAMVKALALPKGTDLAELRERLRVPFEAEGAPLSGATSVVFDPKAPPYPVAVMGLKAAGAAVSIESLSNAETIKRINDFVADRTKGLIPTIIDRPLKDGGLVALDALYFKAAWKAAFDPKATKDEPFQRVGQAAATVKMMHAPPAEHLFRADETFVGITLPYANDGYTITLVTTKGTPAKPADFRKAQAWLDGKDFKPGKASLVLPRFSVTGSFDLIASLDKLGLSPTRRSPKALAGFSPSPQVLSQVLHKTVVKLDEAGTEAAAATAATTARSMPSPGDAVELRFDRPFLFSLRHDPSGVVVMTGYVGDPTAE